MIVDPAPPNSPAADALALLRVIGLQRLEDDDAGQEGQTLRHA